MRNTLIFLLPISCLLFTVAGRGQGSQQFVAAKNLSPSTNLGGAYATGDINRDGKLDVITFDSSSNSYVTLLGNGDGTFTEKVPASPVPAGTTVRLGDVNGDGFPDLVTDYPGPVDNDGSGTGYGQVTVYLGDGTGNFNQIWSANIGAGCCATLYLADVNGDGRLDVITGTDQAYQGTGYVQVFLSSGGGTFQQRSGVGYSALLAAGDLNGDGKADLVAVGGTQINGVQILLSNGDGTFSPGSSYGVSFDSFAPVVIADFNKDGHQDLAVVDGFGGKTSILIGKGDGTFTIKSQFSNTYPAYPGAENLTIADSAAVADLNGDGNLDLVTYSRAYFSSPTGETPSTVTSGIVSVNRGNGDGSFTIATNYSATAATSGSGLVATGNFHGKGSQDVVIGGFNNAGVFAAGVLELLPGTKSGGGLLAPINTLSADPFSLVHADLNHDGIEDIAVVNQGCSACNTTVSVYLGSGKGYFNPPKTYAIGQTQGSIAAGDVNSDGNVDLVVTRGSQTYITPMVKTAASQSSSDDDTSVLLGNGDGTFLPAINSVLLGPAGSSVTALLVDMNGDGKLDLVGDWGVALGKGNGSFQAPKAFPSSLYEIEGLSIGDLNGDGVPDVVVYGLGTELGTIQTLLGDGTGAFTLKNTLAYPHYEITDLKLAQIYGGTERDLVFAGESIDGANPHLSTNLVATLKGNGDGTFAVKKTTVLANLPLSLTYGDYDRDGKLDVVVSDRLGTQYLKGNGDGTFHAPLFFPGTATYLQSLDENRDGALDVLGITPLGVQRLLNTSTKD